MNAAARRHHCVWLERAEIEIIQLAIIEVCPQCASAVAVLLFTTFPKASGYAKINLIAFILSGKSQEVFNG